MTTPDVHAGDPENGRGPYKRLHRSEFVLGDLSLQAVEPEDIEPIRRWRNAQMNVLRQSEPISPSQQRTYFATNIWPEKWSDTPRTILLSYRERGVLIGYGGFVHIAWPHARAEVSFLLAPEHEQDPDRRERLCYAFLKGLQRLAFEDLALARLYTETYAIRDRHIATLEAAGFQREGRLRNHVRIDGAPVDCVMHGVCVGDARPDGEGVGS